MPDNVSATGPAGELIDNHGRGITYLRLAITDRCNLRCRYCMPEQGADFVPHHEILTFEEMLRLVGLLCGIGISKVRITGGEPFVRRGCLEFLKSLKRVPGLAGLHLTTNGVAVAEHLDDLAALGIDGVNLSLDTMDRGRFQYLCRRDRFPLVWETFKGCLARQIPLKVNTVVQEETRDDEIRAMATLARDYPVCLRFIEKMAFSGGQTGDQGDRDRLRSRLYRLFPEMIETAGMAPATARVFKVPGYEGTLGIIEGYSRRFCATCNKIRITPQGMLKTCLYDSGVLDLRHLLRSGADDDEIVTAIRVAVGRRFADGLETEAKTNRAIEPSMASIGG